MPELKVGNSLCSQSVWLSPAALPSASFPSLLSSGPLSHRRYKTQNKGAFDDKKQKANRRAWKHWKQQESETQSLTSVNLTSQNNWKLELAGIATVSVPRRHVSRRVRKHVVTGTKQQ